MEKLVKQDNPMAVEKASAGVPTERRSQARLTPPVKVYESDDTVIVEIEMPGVQRDKIDVTVERDELRVKGYRTVEDHCGVEVLYQERPYGVYERSFILGETIDGSNVTASYENGVLKLTLPKAEKAKPKKIPIN